MRKKDLAVVILAAGKGTRMNADQPKVLHLLDGRPLVRWVVDAAKALSPSLTVLVVGFGGDKVRNELDGEEVIFAEQVEQLGTAHAVMQAQKVLERFEGRVAVLSGDVPLIKSETLNRLIDLSVEKNSAVAFLTIDAEDPTGYGRVVRDGDGEVIAIVEDTDADENQKKLKEINGGVYVFDSRFLFAALPKVSADNRQKEYYLTDLPVVALADGLKTVALKIDDPEQLAGINRPEELERLSRALLSGKDN